MDACGQCRTTAPHALGAAQAPTTPTCSPSPHIHAHLQARLLAGRARCHRPHNGRVLAEAQHKRRAVRVHRNVHALGVHIRARNVGLPAGAANRRSARVPVCAAVAVAAVAALAAMRAA
eukprot:257532-Chlamydomonas_euryale.AAC.1